MYFSLIKLIFNSKDIVNNDPIEKTVSTISSSSRIASCFETDKKYIICFYQNKTLEYIMGVYDNNLNNKKYLSIEDGTSSEFLFYKAIHFTGEVGAFGYYVFNDGESHLYIQFKKYDNITNTISDYFISNPLIKIDKGGNLTNDTSYNDIIKLTDSKFCFSVYHGELQKFYVIIVNNYNDEKIKIRYFYVNFYRLYYYRYPIELELSLYNNLIAMATSGKNDYDSDNTQKSYLIIISYPNSTDYDIELQRKLKLLQIS